MAQETDEIVISRAALERINERSFDKVVNKVAYPFIEPALLGQITENISMKIDMEDVNGMYFVPSNNIIIDEDSGLGDAYEVLTSAAGLSQFAGDLIEAEDQEVDRVTELYVACGIARLVLPVRLQLLQRSTLGKPRELVNKIDDFLLDTTAIDDWNMFTNGNYNLPMDGVQVARGFFDKIDDDRLRIFNMTRAVIGMAFYALSDDEGSEAVQLQLHESWRARTLAGFSDVQKMINVGSTFLGVPGTKATAETVLYNAADHFPTLSFAGMTALTGAEVTNNFVVANYSEYNVDE